MLHFGGMKTSNLLSEYGVMAKLRCSSCLYFFSIFLLYFYYIFVVFRNLNKLEQIGSFKQNQKKQKRGAKAPLVLILLISF